MILFKLLFSVFPFIISLWYATQKIAASCQYDPLLGAPFYSDAISPIYLPWMWFTWRSRFGSYLPQLFRQTEFYLVLGLCFSLLVAFFVFAGEKKFDSHGSAHWAGWFDIVKMDFFGKHGIVIGRWDSPLMAVYVRFMNSIGDLSKAYPLGLLKRIHKILTTIYGKIPPTLLMDNSNLHAALTAGTRTGKGVSSIINTQLGGWNDSMVVNDIKSENWGVTSGYRKQVMRQKVIKFEPTQGDGSSARWNPLDEIPVGSPDEVSSAMNMALTLADSEGKGKLDHWGANAATVISTVILHLKYAHYSDPEHYPYEPSLSSVASFLKQNYVTVWEDNKGKLVPADTPGAKKTEKAVGFLDTLRVLKFYKFQHVPKDGINIREWNSEKGCFETRNFKPEDLKKLYPQARALDFDPYSHPIVSSAFDEILAKPEDECGSIISTANTALKEYLDPILAANTSCSDFCINDVLNYKDPVSLYLVTPPADLIRLSPIFRLFFEYMIKVHTKKIGAFEKGQVKALYKHRCLLLIDEFSSLGNLQAFAATLSFSAGYGIKVYLVNQGLKQIRQNYGPDNNILLNCGVQVFFGLNDDDTPKYVSERLGTQTILEYSETDSGLFKRRQKTYNKISRPLMYPDEVSGMADTEIISMTTFPPIHCNKARYYEYDMFRKRLMDAPAVSDIIRYKDYKKGETAAYPGYPDFQEPLVENEMRRKKIDEYLASKRKKDEYIPFSYTYKI